MLCVIRSKIIWLYIYYSITGMCKSRMMPCNIFSLALFHVSEDNKTKIITILKTFLWCVALKKGRTADKPDDKSAMHTVAATNRFVCTVE